MGIQRPSFAAYFTYHAEHFYGRNISDHFLFFCAVLFLRGGGIWALGRFIVFDGLGVLGRGAAVSAVVFSHYCAIHALYFVNEKGIPTGTVMGLADFSEYSVILNGDLRRRSNFAHFVPSL